MTFSACLEFNCFQLLFFFFPTQTLNLEMMELVSGTLAFLRQNPHLLSVQDSEQTASLTGNIKSQLNTYRDSLSTLKENLKIEMTQH